MWRIKMSIQLVTIRLNKITNLDIVIVLLGSISDIFFEGSISDSDDAYGLSLYAYRAGG